MHSPGPVDLAMKCNQGKKQIRVYLHCVPDALRRDDPINALQTYSYICFQKLNPEMQYEIQTGGLPVSSTLKQGRFRSSRGSAEDTFGKTSFLCLQVWH